MRSYKHSYDQDHDRKNRKRKSRSPRKRSRSYHKDRSRSRSKPRKNKRQFQFDIKSLAKSQSDLKNHFKFIIPNLGREDQSQTLSMLKNKLTQCMGPVEHVTKSKQSRGQQNAIINVGFKFDVDAATYMQDPGDLTIILNSHKIRIKPTPTKVFELYLSYGTQKEERNGRRKRRSSSRSRKRSSSYSSSSSSEPQKQREKKLLIFGIPSFMKESHLFAGINNLPNGPYRILDHEWKKVKNTNCQYMQIRIEPHKGDTLLKNKHKLEIGGLPVVVIEQDYSVTDSLNKHQICISFSVKVHCYHVRKWLQKLARVVQIVAVQQLQQGQSKSFIVTLNDKLVVSDLKKVGRLSSGIVLEPVQTSHLVYRPISNSN